MVLPDVLAGDRDWPHETRIIGAFPFVAALAGLGIGGVLDWLSPCLWVFTQATKFLTEYTIQDSSIIGFDNIPDANPAQQHYHSCHAHPMPANSITTHHQFRAVRQRLRQMRGLDLFTARQIRDGA